MQNIYVTLFNAVDIAVIILLGVWFVSTKGKLTYKDQSIHKFPVKWVYVGGYVLIFGGLIKIIEKFFL